MVHAYTTHMFLLLDQYFYSFNLEKLAFKIDLLKLPCHVSVRVLDMTHNKEDLRVPGVSDANTKISKSVGAS